MTTRAEHVECVVSSAEHLPQAYSQLGNLT